MEILPLDCLASGVTIVNLGGKVAKLAKCWLDNEGRGTDWDSGQGYNSSDLVPSHHRFSGCSGAIYGPLNLGV
jgi:hypothetical protein